MDRVIRENDHEDELELVEISGPTDSEGIHSPQVEAWLSGKSVEGVQVATVQVPRSLLWKLYLFQLCRTLISRSEAAMDIQEGQERKQNKQLEAILALML